MTRSPDPAPEGMSVTQQLIELIKSSRDLTRTSEELALATIEVQERARTARRRFMITMLILGGLSLIVVVAIFALIAAVNRSLDNGHAVRDQIVSCVDPRGACYKEGQSRTGNAISSINKVSILAAACAPTYTDLPLSQRIVAIQKCVERGLKKK